MCLRAARGGRGVAAGCAQSPELDLLTFAEAMPGDE